MTRFTTHFGFQSTAAEVIAGVDLTRRKAIVTGGAAGIGAETVRALAGAGAAVTMAVRRVHVAEPVSFPKIISAHSDDAVRKGLVW